MSPNIKLIGLKKDSIEQNMQKQKFENQVQDLSGLQFARFHFVTGDQEIKTAILVKV